MDEKEVLGKLIPTQTSSSSIIYWVTMEIQLLTCGYALGYSIAVVPPTQIFM